MVYSKVVPTVIGKLYLGEIKHKDFFYCLLFELVPFYSESVFLSFIHFPEFEALKTSWRHEQSFLRIFGNSGRLWNRLKPRMSFCG